jgi:DNA uptake protein ComE-like DNA-binding protein
VKDKIKEFLHFGKSERHAIAILIVAILFAFLLPMYLKSLQKPGQLDSDAYLAEIDEFLRKSESAAAADQREFDFNRPDKSAFIDRIKPFPFDPNVLDEKGWVKLGFTPRQSAAIIKYRDKGGKFRVKKDLKKLFMVDEDIYGVLEPYILLEENLAEAVSNGATETKNKTKHEFSPDRTEINGADSAALVRVRGIGPTFAKRIIRYRDKLGGFSDIGQLQGVYGIDSARFIQIEQYLYIDPMLIKRINVNTASLDELRSHPYIDYYIAKSIVDKRIQKGAFNELAELKEIPLIYESLFLKLSPYLTVNGTR